jgi:hypothetical protein
MMLKVWFDLVHHRISATGPKVAGYLPWSVQCATDCHFAGLSAQKLRLSKTFQNLY